MREQIDGPTCRTLPQRVLKKAYEIEHAVVGSGLVRAHDFVVQMCRQTLLPSTVAPDRTPNAGCDGIEEPEFCLLLGPEILRGCLGRNCRSRWHRSAVQSRGLEPGGTGRTHRTVARVVGSVHSCNGIVTAVALRGSCPADRALRNRRCGTGPARQTPSQRSTILHRQGVGSLFTGSCWLTEPSSDGYAQPELFGDIRPDLLQHELGQSVGRAVTHARQSVERLIEKQPVFLHGVGVLVHQLLLFCESRHDAPRATNGSPELLGEQYWCNEFVYLSRSHPEKHVELKYLCV